MEKKQITFASYAKYFFETYKVGKVSLGTERAYLQRSKEIKCYFGDQLITDINRKDCQNVIDIYGKNRSKITVKKFYQFVKICAESAVDDGLIDYNFAKNITINNFQRKASKINYLEMDKADELKQVCIQNACFRKINYYVILTGLLTGARIGEVLGLTWDCIDFENGTVEINKNYDYLFTRQFLPTKTESSMRTIAIPSQLVATLKKLKTEQQAYFEEHDYINKNNSVFKNSHFTISCNTAVNKLLHKILKKINATNISFHGLRHTHASILINQGVSVEYIAERLGHASKATTMVVYSHLLKPKYIKDESKTLKLLNDL